MALKEKPVVDVDDLYIILRHHYAISDDYYAHERERIQHSLLILFMTCTTARPATLIEGCGYHNSNECLKYKDIEIFKVRDPTYPEQQVFLMKVTLRLMKGKRNAGLP